MLGWLTRLFGRKRLDVDELARRLDLPAEQLARTAVEYRELAIPKRSGGVRNLAVPAPTLKQLQRKLLRRVFGKLRAHPAAFGFERGRSIVDHAGQHNDSDVVVKFDLCDFFTSTSAARVEAYFRTLGWNDEASALLTKLCTWQGSLPQGAPTSPRLSNLVNHGLDARLAGVAASLGGTYSRYADDLTFSLDGAAVERVGYLVHHVKIAARETGYRLNKRKTRIMRRHQRQQVTGLVINLDVNLPRETRRRLRAIEHQRRRGGDVTLSDAQLAGWRAFRTMIEQAPRG
jgi:retron-type reverse transcriptase